MMARPLPIPLVNDEMFEATRSGGLVEGNKLK